MKILIPKSISSMETLYEFLRNTLHEDFPSNLDALADILSDIPDILFEIEDISHFRTVFNIEMTKNYFWNRLGSDSELLGDILLEIFHLRG